MISTPPPPKLSPVRGVRGALLYCGGLVALGMAYLAVVVPGVPATPWVLLASFCFARTSPRLQKWLWYSPGFGPLIRDFTLHRGMRPRSKRIAVPMVVVACSASIAFTSLPDWAKGCIAAAGLVGVLVIVFAVPTVRNPDAG